MAIISNCQVPLKVSAQPAGAEALGATTDGAEGDPDDDVAVKCERVDFDLVLAIVPVEEIVRELHLSLDFAGLVLL